MPSVDVHNHHIFQFYLHHAHIYDASLDVCILFALLSIHSCACSVFFFFSGSVFLQNSLASIQACCETLEESNYRLQKEMLEKQREISTLKKLLEEKELYIHLLEKRIK